MLESFDASGDAREVGERVLSLIHGSLRTAWENAGCRVKIDKGRAGTSTPPSQPVKPWMDEELLEIRRALLQAQRRKSVMYSALRSDYRMLRDAKKAAWRTEWRIFWTTQWKADPASVWRHLKILMGHFSFNTISFSQIQPVLVMQIA